MPVFLSGSLIITGSMTTSGTITAQTLVVQTITSSIVNLTGSNIFGSVLTDTQTFTGSVVMTGSLTVNTTGIEFQVTNNGVVMGNLLADNHSITGSLRVTGSGTFTGDISAIGESKLFRGVFNDPVPNTAAVLKMSATPTTSTLSAVVGARMSGSATANFDSYAGYFSNIALSSGTGLSYGIFATASFHTFIGETRLAQGVFNDPVAGTAASVKISATPVSGYPTAVFTAGATGAASSGQNTFAGYFTNTSTVSGGGINYGIYATGSNHFFGGNVGIGTASPSTVFHVNGSTPRMALITTSGALSSGFYDAFQILAANQTGGGLSLNVGKAESNNNLAKMVYFHSSDGSASNRLGFGFYGADGLVNILAGGNVGIGTSSPTATLHTEINSSTWVSKIINTNTTTNNAGLLIKAGVNSGNEILLAQKANGTTVFLVDAGGNVGIGTSSPSSLLHINGAGTGQMLRIQNTSTVSGDQGPMIQFVSANQVGGQNFESGYIQSIWTGEGNAFSMRFAVKVADGGQVERMRITSGGNVLIGAIGSSSLGTNTKLKVTGNNGSAALGSVFFGGTAAVSTGIPINQFDGGGTLLLIASRHTDAGTATHSAVYIVRFFYDGNNAPTTLYIGGSADFLSFGLSGVNLTVTNSGGGACSVSWFGNK